MGTPAKHGKKRKSTATPTKKAPGSARKSRKVFEPLSIDNYRPKQAGSRVLSCGEGEQLGHPGRNVTRKPRAVDTFSKGMKFVQVAAGGVHSLVLTTEGKVYSCGINEKGTVPVQGLEAEGSTDTFSEIVFAPEIEALGKIVQITAGASFSAALTEKGSVVAWGNLRDTQGEVNVHETLKDIQKKPVVVIRHKSKEHWHIVKVEAGENHLAMLSNEGELLTFGEGSMGQLGRTTRTEHIRSKFMVDSSGTSLILRVLEKHQFLRFVDVWARGFWTIGRAEDGRLFACGLNNFGQLGVLPEVTKPSRGRGRRSASTKRRNGTTQPAADGGNVVPASAEALNFDELDISAVQQASSEDSSQEAEGGDSSANDEANKEKRQKPEQPDGPAATDEEKKKPETEKQKVEEESKDNGRQQAEDNVKDNKNADNSTDDSLLDLKLDESVESAAAAADKSQRQNGGDAEPQKPAAASVVEPNQIASSSAAGNQQQLQQQQLKAKPKDEEMIDDSAADDQQQQQPKIIGQEEANKVALLTWAQAFPADKVWTELAGVQHIVCCNGDGELYGIGKNTDNALGLGTWEGNQDEEHWRYDTLEKIPLPEGARAAGVDATLGASICWTVDGKAYGFGCDTTGQLGLGLKDDDDKIVPTPRQIDSAHLDGFRVIAVSLADNHALFLAAPADDGMKKDEEEKEEEMPMAPAQQESEASAAPTTTQEEQQPAKEEAEEGK